jgi:hypothetical protein
MESLGHAGHTEGSRRALLGYPSQLQVDEAAHAPIRRRKAHGHREEVHKLLAARFIKEVFHPEWLANPIVVRKKGGNGGCV